uniref:Thioredoxin domain-containing protein n=1 Tax=Eptatretus burgeri TaxID=7764 RepID=A0A8C4WXV0_EPTBU
TKRIAESQRPLGLPRCSCIIIFYAPWCGHCKNLEPVWNEVATEMQASMSPIRVGKLDATVNTGKHLLLIRTLAPSVSVAQGFMYPPDVGVAHVSSPPDAKKSKKQSACKSNFKNCRICSFLEQVEGDVSCDLKDHDVFLHSCWSLANKFYIYIIKKFISFLPPPPPLHSPLSIFIRNYQFGFMNGPDYMNNILMSELPVPCLLVYNFSNRQYFKAPKLPSSAYDVSTFLTAVLNGEETSIMSVSPLLACIMFGLPMGIIGIMCYWMCTADDVQGQQGDSWDTSDDEAESPEALSCDSEQMIRDATGRSDGGPSDLEDESSQTPGREENGLKIYWCFIGFWFVI